MAPAFDAFSPQLVPRVWKMNAPAKDDGGDETVQKERAGEVGAQLVAAVVFVITEFELSGYGTLLTFESAG